MAKSKEKLITELERLRDEAFPPDDDVIQEAIEWIKKEEVCL